jgi:hypothetical protein
LQHRRTLQSPANCLTAFIEAANASIGARAMTPYPTGLPITRNVAIQDLTPGLRCDPRPALMTPGLREMLQYKT